MLASRVALLETRLSECLHKYTAIMSNHQTIPTIDCRICFESVPKHETAVAFPCRHDQFCVECMQQWRQACFGTCPCPVCNENVTEIYGLHQLDLPFTTTDKSTTLSDDQLDNGLQNKSLKQKIVWFYQCHLGINFSSIAMVATFMVYFATDCIFFDRTHSADSVPSLLQLSEYAIASVGLTDWFIFLLALVVLASVRMALIVYDRHDPNVSIWALIRTILKAEFLMLAVKVVCLVGLVGLSAMVKAFSRRQTSSQ
jgi:hypothetical protein